MLCFTVGPPIAAAIMKKDPWISFTLGLILQAVAIPISLALPETLGAKKPGEPEKKEEKPTDKEESILFGKGGNVQDRSGKLVQMIKDNAGFIAKDWRVLFFACTYPIRMMMNSLDSQIMQYIPQRYHWSIANTTNLQAVQAGVAMVVLLFILPAASSYLLKKRGYSSNRKDIFITRFGFFCYGIGLLAVGFAPTIFYFIIGMITITFAVGCGSAIRALLTSWVKQNEVARLYTALGIIETIGSMCGGPLISTVYNAGLSAYHRTKESNDLILGLPWICAGLVMTGLAVGTCIVRLNDKNDRNTDSEQGYQRAPDDDFEASVLAPTVGVPPALQTPTVPMTPLTPRYPTTPRTPFRSRVEKFN